MLVTRCEFGAGGGGRTPTRGEPNGILSRRDGARLQGIIAHNGPRVATIAGSFAAASST
jgi:hypothetical protein